jgi:hypothetical protein
MTVRFMILGPIEVTDADHVFDTTRRASVRHRTMSMWPS